MKLWTLSGIVALVAVCGQTGWCQESESSRACEAKLVRYSEGGNVDYTLSLESGNGRLYYFGAEHSTDPKNPQFARMDEAWKQLKPTVAFYEGPNRPVAESREKVIGETGESGYLRFLAARDGARIERLEPDPKAEAEYVMEKFPQEQVELFYFLREAARLRERRGAGEAEIKQTISKMLERAKSLGIPQSLSTTDDLQKAYATYFESPKEWWQVPANWFTPNPQDAERFGGKFFHAINERSSEFRDINMYRVIRTEVLKGGRVFAVVGRNHVPMQAPALRCALGK